jgi:hypothetical protein
VRERRVWAWLKFTPLLVITGLIGMQVFVPVVYFMPVVSWTWLGIASVSLVCADIARRYTSRLLILATHQASDNSPEDQAWLFRVETNHVISVLTEYIHLIFVGIGVLVALVPEGSPVRQHISTNGLLFGQYLLLMIVARNYLSYAVMNRELEQSEGEGHDEREQHSEN